MSLVETLEAVVAALDAAAIPHMVAGSLASTYHGEPRSTQDVDMVIDPPSTESLDSFASHLEDQDFYVGDYRAAYDRRSMFNVVAIATGWKVDLVIRHDRPFSLAEFQRRTPTLIEGIPVHVATAEDTILAKLEWARHSGSERQRRDVEAIVEVLGSDLDVTYLQTWADRLGLAAELDGLLAAGPPADPPR